MAYLIRVLNNFDVQDLANKIVKAIQVDGRFRSLSVTTYAMPWNKKVAPVIDMGRIRLIKSKKYCGQHPGECQTGGPRRSGPWLEWKDWVSFHSLINDVLDSLSISADVTTKPMETVAKVRGLKGLFWIRKAKARRLHYMWEEKPDSTGWRPVRWWNPGTEDQFSAEPQAATTTSP